MITSIGKQLITEKLPVEYRGDHINNLTDKSLRKLFTVMAKHNPEKYQDVMHDLMKVGKEVVSTYGKEGSLNPYDLKLPPALKQYKAKAVSDVKAIINNPILSDKDKNKKIIDTMMFYMKKTPKLVLDEAKKAGSGIAIQSSVGARGNQMQLTQLLFGDILVVDADNKPVPIPSLHGYGEGVTPLEYWAASNGARKGSIDVQFATANAGYLGKQLNNIGHKIVVTEDDCGTANGHLSAVDDEDNIGSVLAQDNGKLKAGTLITEKNMKDLKGDKVLIRSAITCQADHGICGKCAGHREDNDFPQIGEVVGGVAARALAEPVTQAGLCLAKNTEVFMADYSVKYIQDIQRGDYVLGADKEGNTFTSKVTDIFYQGIKPVYKTEYISDKYNIINLLSTLDHKVLQLVQDKIGIERAGIEGKEIYALQKKRKKNINMCKRLFQTLIDERETYDIQVDNKDHLFVLANGLIVSNSTKHSGGVAGADDKKVQGFEELNQFLQVPSIYQGGAVLAEIDGTVSNISKAPSGLGDILTINGKDHFIHKDKNLIVKQGDTLSAGDTLTTGVPNPAEVVAYKGIGEGRKYFVDRYMQMLKENGANVHRRNVEAVARGFINRVKITKPEGYQGHLVGDVVPYDDLVRSYEPRPDSQVTRLSTSRNSYLETPLLYYSIGTRITPHVIKDLTNNGYKSILTNKTPPPFEPVTVKARNILESDNDWMVRLGGENLKRATLSAAQKGSVSSKQGLSYIPTVADSTSLDSFNKNNYKKLIY